MIQIRQLELHATHACNLHCQGCTHFSDYGHKGMLTVEKAKSWFDNWKNRITPTLFAILGGEPTINPKLCEIIALSRQAWPISDILLVSNGFFLENHPNLPDVLKENHVRIDITIHGKTKEYRDKVKTIKELVSGWPVQPGWRYSYKRWQQMYQGYGSSMKPYEDNNQRKSWDVCGCKLCMQLHEGMLWKCPPIAYLSMQAQKMNLGPEWDKYLTYKPLEHTCSDLDLAEFIQRKDEAICQMCPAGERFILKPDPLKSVSKKIPLPIATYIKL